MLDVFQTVRAVDQALRVLLFYVSHSLVLIAIIKEYLPFSNRCMLHVLFWHHVSTQRGHIRSVKQNSLNVLHSVVLNNINLFKPKRKTALFKDPVRTAL